MKTNKTLYDILVNQRLPILLASQNPDVRRRAINRTERAIVRWHHQELEAALMEVIGEDEVVYDAMYSERNRLRANQRARAKKLLERGEE